MIELLLPEALQANAGILLGLLALGQVATGVAGLRAGERQADFQEDLAQADRDDRRLQARRLLARQRVAFAKSGVNVDTGTPLDVQADTAAQEELAILRAGLPFDVRAERFRTEGRSALIGGISSGFTTVASNPLSRSSFPSIRGAVTRRTTNILGPLLPRATGTGRP